MPTKSRKEQFKALGGATSQPAPAAASKSIARALGLPGAEAWQETPFKRPPEAPGRQKSAWIDMLDKPSEGSEQAPVVMTKDGIMAEDDNGEFRPVEYGMPTTSRDFSNHYGKILRMAEIRKALFDESQKDPDLAARIEKGYNLPWKEGL